MTEKNSLRANQLLARCGFSCTFYKKWEIGTWDFFHRSP